MWIKSLSVTIEVRAFEQYFLVVLFSMLYKVVLAFEFVDRLLAVPFWSVDRANLSREPARRDWSEQTSRGEPGGKFVDVSFPKFLSSFILIIFTV